MLDIEFLKNIDLFEIKSLKKDEYIFKQGDFDENLYIILSGKVSVEKHTTIEEKDTRELNILFAKDFFGEASLNNQTKKEVNIKALEDTELLYINAASGLEKFIEKYPKQGLELLKYIIVVTNSRLSKENKQITANYEIVKSIVEIKKINEKNIFLIIEKIKLITGFDYILYFEVNPVITNYIVLKYDSREAGKLQDKIIDSKKLDNIKELDEIKLVNFNFIQKLSIGDLDLGYMIYGKKSDFSYEDKKLITSVSNNLTGVLKQKEIMKEELNKNYMKNI